MLSTKRVADFLDGHRPKEYNKAPLAKEVLVIVVGEQRKNRSTTVQNHASKKVAPETFTTRLFNYKFNIIRRNSKYLYLFI